MNTYDQTVAGVVTGAVSAKRLRLSGRRRRPNDWLAERDPRDRHAPRVPPGNGGIRGGTLSTTRPLRVVTSGDLTIGTAAEPTAVVAPDGFVKAGPGRLTLFGTAASTHRQRRDRAADRFGGRGHAGASATRRPS